MNRILVLGYTPFADGINTFIKNTYPYLDHDLFQYDFLVSEQLRGVIENSRTFDDLGCNVHYFDYIRQEMPKRSYRKLKEIFQSIPDLCGVHVHDTNQMTYPLYLADRLGLPIKVIHYHSSFPKHGQIPKTDPHVRGRLNLIRGDQFDRLACSNLAGICGFRGMPFEIIPNGIIPEKYSFDPFYRELIRERLGVKDDRYVVGFFANISEVKNPVFALKVFQEILKIVPGSIFVFVGVNYMKKILFNYVCDNHLTDHVRFLQTDDSMDMLYSAADLALCTSFREGFGFALLEAQASGLPCLISDEADDSIRITDLAHMMSLEATPEEWAKKALQIMQGKNKRISHTKEITDSGFHARDSAKKLQEIYLHRLQNN